MLKTQPVDTVNIILEAADKGGVHMNKSWRYHESFRQGGSLSKEQCDFYDREGYLVLEGLLSEGDIAVVQQSLTDKVDQIAEQLLAAGLIQDTLKDRPFPTRLAELFGQLTADHFLKYGRSWRDRLPGYYHL